METHRPLSDSASSPARMAGRLTSVAVWSYLVGLLAAWSALHWAGDRWWMATVLLFAPRWLWGLPLCALAPVVLLSHRRLLWVIGLASLIVVGPIMGLCLPWRISFASQTTGTGLRVLTCNGDSRDLDPVRFSALLSDLEPNIVAMQDVWAPHVADIFKSDGWYVHIEDGLCLASRFPIRAVEPVDSDAVGPGLGRAICYALETPAGVVRCFNLHLATPRWGLLAVVRGQPYGSDKLQSNSALRRHQSTAISRQASTLQGLVLLAGDFNTPVESTIYRKCWTGYTNAFSVAGLGWGNTHLTKHTGVRIDHILASSDWRVRRCWVGPDVGSAHRPVIADLVCRTPASRSNGQSRIPSTVERR